MSTFRKKYRVFISAIREDLKNECVAVVDAIKQFGYIPFWIEDFSPTGSENLLETYKNRIDESDIYTLLLGHPYESLSPGVISKMEEEYDYAVLEKKLPCFIILIDESELENRVGKNKESKKQEDIDKYYAFRNKIEKTRICRYYKDIRDIKLAVYESLLDIKYKFIAKET